MGTLFVYQSFTLFRAFSHKMRGFEKANDIFSKFFKVLNQLKLMRTSVRKLPAAQQSRRIPFLFLTDTEPSKTYIITKFSQCTVRNFGDYHIFKFL